MKKIILIFFLFPLLFFKSKYSQSNNTYKEINIGIALFDDSGLIFSSFRMFWKNKLLYK